MKTFLVFLSFCFSLTYSATAQPQKKVEKDFLNELNSILKKSPTQHWGYDGTMTIDSAFSISPTGILSVTVRYSYDSSFMRARMEAPVSKIIGIAYDLYLILEFTTDEVPVYRSDEGSNELKEISKTYYFHIGEPVGDGLREKEKIEKLLEKLLKYYPD